MGQRSQGPDDLIRAHSVCQKGKLVKTIFDTFFIDYKNIIEVTQVILIVGWTDVFTFAMFDTLTSALILAFHNVVHT